MKKLWQILGILMLLGHGEHGLASSGGMQVVRNNDCGPLDYQVSNGGLVIEFERFTVETNQKSYFEEKVCEIEVTNIHVPAGKQLRPSQALADGEVFTSESGGAYAYLDYTWMGETISAEATFESGILSGDNYILTTPYAGWWAYTPCSYEDQYAVMQGRFHINVSSEQYDKQSSSLQLANSEAQMKASWNWEWQDCEVDGQDWLQKRFRSRYTNDEGRWIRGYTQFLKPDFGRYDLDNGSFGEFENIEFSEDGTVVSGNWIFENGRHGWFQFLLGLEKTSFDGNWGYGKDVGVAPVGRWTGYVVD
ncbi:DUF4360 domain-containing protein [Pseudobacteriovorax antillogorgiicola]|uniref:Uncharacterized protein n=1 Tax=Pseudobacteriovorax antillogorgiicola TaxID=1513793 RepID=A0A1Y6CK88_9BACT|nr:DUF4360 domain-containing protein [Pseudobacteriovorax antillogorgiicola]TCS45613.1 uncharacterized protein DUF4360 [Pseudobacteriovorax antillogorgiicola]SMF72362.1 protein of unknown function [Pseudobacteriovorax antillogorgiicola]